MFKIKFITGVEHAISFDSTEAAVKFATKICGAFDVTCNGETVFSRRVGA